MCVCKCVYNWFILLYTWNSVNQLFTMIEGRRRRGGQRMRWFNGITDSMDMNLGKLWKIVRNRKAWHAAVHGVAKSRTQLSDWTTTTANIKINLNTRKVFLPFLRPILNIFQRIYYEQDLKEYSGYIRIKVLYKCNSFNKEFSVVQKNIIL